MGRQMLGEPAPFLSVFDKIDRRTMDAEFRRDFTLCPRIDERRHDLLVGQNGLIIPLASRLASCMPTFDYRVVLVIVPGSQKEMRRIDTRRIVAPMANLHIWVKRTLKMFIEKSAGHDFACPPWGHAITTGISRTLPNPATLIIDLITGQGVGAWWSHSTKHAQPLFTHQGVR